MFDLETALATWLAQFNHRPGYSREDLLEIERHIRDHVASLERRGNSVEEAFRTATASFGTFDDTDHAYSRVYWGKQRRSGTLLRAVAGRWSLVRHYATTAHRSLVKHPGFSAMNILCLGVGLAVAVLTLAYIDKESGFDRFHDGFDRTYRVLRTIGDAQPSAKSEYLLPEILVSDASGVEAFTRLSRDLQQQIKGGKRRLDRDRILRGRANVFPRVFVPPAVRGSRPGSSVT